MNVSDLKRIVFLPLLIIYFVFYIPLFSQYTFDKFKPRIDAILEQKPKYIARYQRERNPENKLIIQMAYSRPIIMRDDLKKFQDHSGQPIESIDYIITSCRKHNPLTPPESLNRRRLEALAQALPSLFENHLIHFRVLAQVGCKTDKTGANWFHGFVIHFRETPSMDTARRDKKYLSDVAKGKVPKEKIVDPGESESSGKATVLNVLDRNKNWEKMAVVNDLTGSMSPYAAQIIIWHKLNKKKRNPEIYVFFNDGDQKSTEEKTIGNTGGIYYKKVKTEEELGNLMGQTLDGGFGGDSPENDIEAVLFALLHCDECKDIILIADNYSDIRDIELIKKIKKPVHIILCGATAGIHTQYLKLARETGGSVHTIEDDITNLMKLSEGETIKIGDKTYLLKDSKFIVLEEL